VLLLLLLLLLFFCETGLNLNEITQRFVLTKQNGAFLSKEKTRLQHRLLQPIAAE